MIRVPQDVEELFDSLEAGFSQVTLGLHLVISAKDTNEEKVLRIKVGDRRVSKLGQEALGSFPVYRFVLLFVLLNISEAVLDEHGKIHEHVVCVALRLERFKHDLASEEGQGFVNDVILFT